jgi:hypothetical protein
MAKKRASTKKTTAKKTSTAGLTAGQKKLPPGLQKSILAKKRRGKK